MPAITIEPDLHLPARVRPLLPTLALELLPEDAMYSGHNNHYLGAGASALTVILSALDLAGREAPAAILDFGSGAGRVTRWIRAAFPEADIHATDMRPGDLAFCSRVFGARTFPSGTEIDRLAAPATYDLIWVGSVLTHLSERDWRRLVDKLLSWLRPGGILVASIHGRLVAERSGSQYIHPSAWTRIMEEYRSGGYGYADYEGQPGYGISVESPTWTAAAVESLGDVRLVLLSERCWDDHHDVIALQVPAAP